MTNSDTRGGGSPMQGTHAPNSSSVDAEPIQFNGLSVTYDRRFSMGNFEYLQPAVTLWLSCPVAAGEPLDLHHAKERLRRMARENVRAQLLRVQGEKEVVFLGLQPPLAGGPDPIVVQSVCLSLIHSVNLGDGNLFTPGFSDWADLRSVAHHPGELHMALARLWQSLWANLEDELSRARGEGGNNGFFGLPAAKKETLPANLVASIAAQRFSQARGQPEHPVPMANRGGSRWTP